jgi:hypothetical protein
MNKALCELASKGKVGIKNDGTRSQLEQVLRFIFPEDRVISRGKEEFYYRADYDHRLWESIPKGSPCHLPTHSVSEFLKEEASDWKPKNGEEVEVSDDEVYWNKRTFIIIHKKMFICEGDIFGCSSWKFCRPLPAPETEKPLTLESLQTTISELRERLKVVEQEIKNKK